MGARVGLSMKRREFFGLAVGVLAAVGLAGRSAAEPRVIRVAKARSGRVLTARERLARHVQPFYRGTPIQAAIEADLDAGTATCLVCEPGTRHLVVVRNGEPVREVRPFDELRIVSKLPSDLQAEYEQLVRGGIAVRA